MADGSLRIEVEVEPQDAQAAFALFGRPGAPMALAALAVGHAAVQEPEPVTVTQLDKPLARWVAMRCKGPEFQSWATQYEGWGGSRSEANAAALVRHLCGVASRGDIDGNAHAEERFHYYIRIPYAEWCARQEVTA
jgi:hypothetical protein